MNRDTRTRAGIEQHWAASERGDIDTEHAIYARDAILDYPQSGERFRGRSRIQAQRGGHPAERHFTVLRIRGAGDLWVSECIITYDGTPSYTVSIMEFADGLVTHETQYFADPFPAPAIRSPLAEPIPDHEKPARFPRP
ncbi:nuclear transport factor 2 family protein [Nonomuraea wenchangensis]|uniref:nuclear transport factor 2 family protein n=1 Tax=Nonomuraea wenchangensis TaxID=568860 RepID=UPI0037B4C768